MKKPYAYLEAEATQMEEKSIAARKEILRLKGIADTCDKQARSLRWAIEEQKKADAEHAG